MTAGRANARPPGSLSERAGDMIITWQARAWWAAVAAIAVIVALEATGIVL
jgi:hypothetical protein